jgi:TP901 family phage tail tape measure protein
MAVNIGPKIGIDGEAEYRKQINNIIQSTKTLKSEYQALENTVNNSKNPFKNFANELENNKKKHDVLSQALDEQKAKLTDLRNMAGLASEKFGENATETLKWKQAVADAEAECGKLEEQLQAIPSTLSSIGGAMSSVGSSMTSFGKDLSMKVTAPLAGIGAVAAKNFAEVDKTMQLTNATMKNTEEQADMLNQAMKDAAANSTFGMNDAATATLNFARAGLAAEEAAAALAPAMNLAAGEGGDLDTVSAGLVATINGFGGTFDEASHYADVFAAACNNSALDVNSLSESMSVAAPVFSAAGYSVNDAALYMGVMANSGIEASVAANALKTGFARLVAPADAGAAAMEQLGISVTEADGSMKSAMQIQYDLHEAFGKLSESEQIAAASAIFGKNQMANWLTLINTAPEEVQDLNLSLYQASFSLDDFYKNLENIEGPAKNMVSNLNGLGIVTSDIETALTHSGGSAEEFVKQLEAMNDEGVNADEIIKAMGGDMEGLQSAIDSTRGTTDLMAEAMMSGFGGSMEKLKSSVDVASTSLGEALAPSISKVADGVQKAVDWFNQLTPAQQSIIAKAGVFVASIGPVLVILGTLASSIGSIVSVAGTMGPAFTAISTLATGTLAPAISTVATTLMGPLGIAIAGAIAAGVLLYENWDTVKEWAGKLASAVSEKWTAMKETIASKWDAVKAKTSEAWGNVKSVVSSGASFIHATASNRLNEIKNAFESNGGGIKGIMAATWEVLTTQFKTGFDVMNALTHGKLGDIANAITGKFSELKDQALDWGKDIIGNLVSGITAKIDDVKNAAKGIAKGISDYIHFSEPEKGDLADFHTFMPDMMKGLADGMIGNLGLVEDAASQVAGAIAQPMQNTNNYGGFSIVVNGAEGQSAREIADEVEARIADKIARQEAVWA